MPRVFLVVTNGEDTDPEPLLHIPCAADSPRTQVTMIRRIPWLMFKHLRGLRAEVDTQFLADIWMFSFRGAKACFRGMTTQKQSCKIEIEESEPAGIPDHHKSLISEFSPDLHRVCGTAMRRYMPNTPHSAGWDLSEIRHDLNKVADQEHQAFTRSSTRDSCYILYAIVCGAIYGLCNNVCFDGNQVLVEDSEIIFSPDILSYDGKKKI